MSPKLYNETFAKRSFLLNIRTAPLYPVKFFAENSGANLSGVGSRKSTGNRPADRMGVKPLN